MKKHTKTDAEISAQLEWVQLGLDALDEYREIRTSQPLAPDFGEAYLEHLKAVLERQIPDQDRP